MATNSPKNPKRPVNGTTHLDPKKVAADKEAAQKKKDDYNRHPTPVKKDVNDVKRYSTKKKK